MKAPMKNYPSKETELLKMSNRGLRVPVKTQRLLWVVVPISLLLCGFAVPAQTASDYDSIVRQGNSQLQAGNDDQALATAQSAIKLSADRWEAYALAGGALMNLKRYEDAADDFSKAIDRAPATKQDGLRELRRKCFAAESGAAFAPASSASASEPAGMTTQAEIVLWKSIENSTNPADFQTYLTQYPHGAFAVLAQRHLDEAKAQAEQQQRRLIAASTWKDSMTGLMWTNNDNGRDLTWQQAMDYCRNLNFVGYSDWRLPTIDELQRIHDPTVNSSGRWSDGSPATFHIRGNLQPSGWEWSSTQGRVPGQAWNFSFADVQPGLARIDGNLNLRAMCVRRSSE